MTRAAGSRARKSEMPAARFAAVCACAKRLPGAEVATSYGTPALKVKGKLFARLKEDGETLVLRTTWKDRWSCCCGRGRRVLSYGTLS